MEHFDAYAPPSTKIASANKQYHVFLSFRGKDSRRKLVDHLFESLSAAGVRVFLDSEKLRKGENIGSSLLQAIRETYIHIPIFSKNYAHSPWCLMEVTAMSNSDGLIIPLFYNVKPSDVRYPDKGPYAEAFKIHHAKGRVEPRTVESWKRALEKVSSLSGWSMETTSRYEGKLVKRVVLDVLSCLDNAPLDITKCAVGLTERMNDVIGLLKLDAVDDRKVITVGIWGIGGVGKTTLAKAVYNNIYRRFDVACFVSDVRANDQRVNGLCKVQRQMLRDLLKRNDHVNNVDHGKTLMKDHLQSVRALVVLDDVDHRRQLDALGAEWLGSGSRVVVTTRDKGVLNVGQIDEIEKDAWIVGHSDEIYTMRELGKDEALQLFSLHAFLNTCPDEDYEHISKRIVNSCCGLPLSLEVLGAFLYKRKDKRCWAEALKQIENAMYDDIYGRLKISYQGLSSQEREIFLDIACFFVGHDKESAIAFWEASNLNPHINLSNLILKSLVGLDNKNEKFVMHDHLRDMGRAIAAGESGDPGKCSRLWTAEDAHQVIQQRLGVESIRRFSNWGSEQSNVSLQTEYLASMKNLQLLWLERSSIEGDLQKLPPYLRWLRWNFCPWDCLPSEWNMEHLAVLDLSTTQKKPSSIKELWKENMCYKRAKNLKVLRMNWCVNLERFPDVSNHRSLLTIDLENCSGMRTLPDSIGLLEQLKCLNLSGCKRLEELPDSISGLLSLEKLYLGSCFSIRKLPNALGELGALKELDIGYLKHIKELPPFGRHSCLLKLNLTGCRTLRWLPESVCELKYLRYLEMNGCQSVSGLPKEFGNLTTVEELFMNDCYGLLELPQSFGNLVNLRILEMKNNRNLIGLPVTFSRLVSLVRLDATCCNLLDGLPEQIGDLLSLEFLNLGNTFVRKLPSTLNKLGKLTTLILNNCNNISELPVLPGGLEKIECSNCRQLVRLPDMSNLEKLKILLLPNCERLVVVPELGSLKSLTKLNICGCKNAKSLGGVEMLKSLQTLHLSGSGISVSDLRPWMQDMPCLQELSIYANGVPQWLEHKMQDQKVLEPSTFKDVISFPVKNTPKCAAVALCFLLKVDYENPGAEMSIVGRDGHEIFNTKVFSSRHRVGLDELYMSIYRENHLLITRLASAERICVRAKGKGILIKECGMHLLYADEKWSSGHYGENESEGRDIGMSNPESLINQDEQREEKRAADSFTGAEKDNDKGSNEQRRYTSSSHDHDEHRVYQLNPTIQSTSLPEVDEKSITIGQGINTCSKRLTQGNFVIVKDDIDCMDIETLRDQLHQARIKIQDLEVRLQTQGHVQQDHGERPYANITTNARQDFHPSDNLIVGRKRDRDESFRMDSTLQGPSSSVRYCEHH